MGNLRGRQIFPALAAMGLFAFMATLYCSGFTSLYRSLIKLWGIHPFPVPFIDTDTVLSAIRCINRGVDVYVANPCDLLDRVYDYSPLWTVLRIFPMTPAWLPPIGLGVDMAFLASLLLLPAGRSWRDTRWITAGVVSSASLFALERGNNDLVLFVLAASAATLACRSYGFRLVGYGLALLAGLLKYYPMTLMLIATRERPLRFLGVAAASTLLVALFVIISWHDLTRALTLIPTGSYFGDMFGARTLGGGLTERMGLPATAARIMEGVMSLAAFGTGVRLGIHSRATAALNERERSFLLVGALLVLSCFFTAQNIGYRAIHLILVLPALSALRDTSSLRRFRYALPLALGALWSGTWYHDLVSIDGALTHRHGTTVVQSALWLLREGMWWVLVTILIACVTELLLASTLVRACRPHASDGCMPCDAGNPPV